MSDIRKLRDRLSELPDGVLHSILSLRPLDNSVRTAALSRRWRHVWCTNPSLLFTFLTLFAVDPSTYIQIVDSCLSLCSSIERISSLSFMLNPRDLDIDSITRRWIFFAASRSVDSLLLEFSDPLQFNLPRPEDENLSDNYLSALADVFSCQTLRSLKLRHCVIPPMPDNHGTPHFPFLESLQLDCVELNKKILIELASSPRLKYLCLHHVGCADPLEISSPTLEVLDIRFCTPASIYDVPIQVHSVPKLRFLGLCMELRQAELFTLAGSDKLEEVTLLWNPKVAPSEIHQWRHMMSIAEKAITLVIDCWFLQTYDLELLGCHGPFFSNLRRLQICGITSQWLPNLIATLGNCPILEHLRFQEHYVFAGETRPWGCQYDNHWGSTRKIKSQAKKLVEESESNSFVMPPLKVVEIVGFECDGILMELVEFILGKAATLESLTVYYRQFDEASDKSFERIKSFYTASPSVELVSSKATGATLYGMARVCTRNYDFGG